MFLLINYVLDIKINIFINIFNYSKFISIKIYGDWGLGIGDWGLGIGPNPQSPIIILPNPNPHI